MSVDGIVSRFAGSSFGYADGDGVSAKFAGITGIGIDALGNIFVTGIISCNDSDGFGIWSQDL